MDLSNLNQQQKSAVIDSLDKNTVVVAGAGAGKTRVLTSRVGYLIDDLDIHQEKIMVVTFTNKAANEIKERLYNICGDLGDMYVGTFHNICVRILRKFGYYINIDKFTIMNSYQSKKLMSEVLKSKMVVPDKSTINKFLAKISNFKNDLKNPKKVRELAKNDEEYLLYEIYNDYQNKSWKQRTFDFDDLIIYAVSLLTNSDDVRLWFQNNIKYIMCDESQDTNGAQFSLLKELAGTNNLFLVGDDDQSIYGFRKANPKYLLNFKMLYPDSKVILLEQNYRSTQTIVNASTSLVKNNSIRYDKTCFSKGAIGDPIILKTFTDPETEAKWIAKEISLLKRNIKLDEIAILFRTNAQSRTIESALLEIGIQYKSVGSLSFYERAEIKDIISYLSVIENPKDKVSFQRALSILPSVGKKTVEKIIDIAELNDIDFTEATEEYINLSKVSKQTKFLSIYLSIVKDEDKSIYATIKRVIEKLNIIERLTDEETEDANSRVDNLLELINLSKEMENKNKKLTISDFLDLVSLSSTTDEVVDSKKVNLLTIHASKGLEYSVVFLVGVEENLLPHARSNSNESIEEERRLLYVGMSRAKELLYITNCMYRNDICQNESRFLLEIPEKYVIKI